jgi:hypothetical protein
MPADPSSHDLSERFVKPGHRYRYLIAGGLLQLHPAAADVFGQRLAQDSRAVTTDELRLLAEGGWQDRMTAAWMAGMDRRTQLRPLIADMLLSDNEPGPKQGCCFALARFATLADAGLLANYLDNALQVPGFGADWALGALLHLDRVNATAVAARFLGPGGPWQRWIAEINPIASQYTTAESERTRLDQLCAFADRFTSRSA